MKQLISYTFEAIYRSDRSKRFDRFINHRKHFLSVFLVFILISCAEKSVQEKESLSSLLLESESITGNEDYLNSPFVTAGDRVYLVGHQDGSFPDLGWHVQGEMGGLWNHPIKLMDGFSIRITESEKSWCLNNAETFTNYPFANKHIFLSDDNELEISRVQFVPDSLQGIVIELALKNNSSLEKNVLIDFTGMVDLSPVWLFDKKGIEDGADNIVWNEETEAFEANDTKNDWFAIFGPNQKAVNKVLEKSQCYEKRKGLGKDATISVSKKIKPGSEEYIQFYISGSYQSLNEAKETYHSLKLKAPELLKKKQNRYESIKKTASLSIPDTGLESMYRWVKYNTDWLIRDVPEVGRGLSAGIPDYPWWFGTDNCYALQGLLASGQHEEVLATIDVILKLSEQINDNGRIMHEASTNGVVFNPGNLNNTPHFAYLLWKTYEWTGRKDLLARWFPKVQQGLDWLLSEQDKNQNLYPDGPGMMEIPGLHTEMVDVASYTQAGLWAAANMAEQLGDSLNQKKYANLAYQLKEKINTEWWVEEFNSYADFRATKSEALELIEGAIVRSDTIDKPWAVKELEQTKKRIKSNPKESIEGYVVHHNWVVNTPTEMGIATQKQAKKTLETAKNYLSKYGTYVTGIDRDEAKDESSKWEVFNYVGAVMTLPTGVQAISEARYGNPDNALEYLERLHNSFSYALPGSLYEVSPDYGMMVQAWTIYSVAVPVVEYFFGIKPKAYQKEIILAPDMPKDWKNVSLENIVIGENEISIQKKTTADGVHYILDQKLEDWKISLAVPGQKISKILVNGKPFIIESKFINLGGKHNEVVFLASEQ